MDNEFSFLFSSSPDHRQDTLSNGPQDGEFSCAYRYLKGYRIGLTLKQNRFSQICEGQHKIEGEEVAIKILKKYYNNRRICNTELLLASLDNPYIIKPIEVHHTAYYDFIVMPFSRNGSLSDYLRVKKSLNEKEAHRLFVQMILGVEYCHRKGVIHRDIKLGNILLFNEYQDIKIIDFGLSGYVHCKSHRFGEFCGTPLYVPPEIVQRKKYKGPPVDVWSLGIVLYFLINGRPPFYSKNVNDLYRKIVNLDYNMLRGASFQLNDLLRRVFTKDPENRITIDEILLHPWITSNILSLSKDNIYLLHTKDDDEPVILSKIDMNNETTSKYNKNDSLLTIELSSSLTSSVLDGNESRSNSTTGISVFKTSIRCEFRHVIYILEMFLNSHMIHYRIVNRDVSSCKFREYCCFYENSIIHRYKYTLDFYILVEHRDSLLESLFCRKNTRSRISCHLSHTSKSEVAAVTCIWRELKLTLVN